MKRAVILMILLAVLLLAFSVSDSVVDEWRDKETGAFLGYMEQVISVEYRDGAVEQVTSNPLLALFYNNRPIVNISYSLRMKKGIEGIQLEVDTSGFVHRIDVHDVNGVKINTILITFDNQSVISVSDEFTEIVSWSRFSLDFVWYHFAEGTYQLSFIPEGVIKHDIGEGWVESTLPSPVFINLDLKDDRVVNIEFR